MFVIRISLGILAIPRLATCELFGLSHSAAVKLMILYPLLRSSSSLLFLHVQHTINFTTNFLLKILSKQSPNDEILYRSSLYSRHLVCDTEKNITECPDVVIYYYMFVRNIN